MIKINQNKETKIGVQDLQIFHLSADFLFSSPEIMKASFWKIALKTECYTD